MSGETKNRFKLNWGILGCGKIAKVWCTDLLLSHHPEYHHVITAVATRNSLARAQDFSYDIPDNEPSSIPRRAYGSYQDLLTDPEVDIIYVNTPHHLHFAHTLACIDAGKHVLVEKPFTINAKQTKIIKEKAEAKGVFCMEAMWTRFLPLLTELKKVIETKEAGEIRRIFGDICLGTTQEELGEDHRLVDVGQGGGVLLDIGIYPLTYPFFLLPNRPYQVSSTSTLMSTGADMITSLILKFPKESKEAETDTHAVITSSLSGFPSDLDTSLPTIRIECTNGEIRIFGPAWNPTGFAVLQVDPEGVPQVTKQVDTGTLVHESMADLRGMWYQADECAKCIRDGLKQSTVMPLSESVKIMEVMDEARRQGGIVYPAEIESVEIPKKL